MTRHHHQGDPPVPLARRSAAIRHAIALLVLLAAALGASPHALAQTVDDVLKRGKLIVGSLIDIPPFGMMDAQQKPEGYDIDVANLMGKYLGVPVEIVPVTGPNRIPFLLTNKVDVLVATFGITPERAKQVAFSIPYSSFDIILLAPKATKIAAPADLSGKRIAVARASTQDTALSAVAPKDATIMRFDDDAAAVQALLSGQADAIGGATTIMSSVIKNNPAKELEQKLLLRRQPNGISVRRNATDLLQWINTFVYFIKLDGELDAIHQKWLGSPLPELPVF
jgi:polar amino acid transport system substrate-binding protein